MYNLYTNQLLLNRKIVSQIAILKGNCLFIISNNIIHFLNKNFPESELREGGRIKEICMIK